MCIWTRIAIIELMRMFIAITLALLCLNTFAAKVATVTTAKAVVFSDKDLTSPLGYVRFGKKIRVSDNPIGIGDIYAVIISGRVAYVQAKDISVSAEIVSETSGHQKINEHNVDELFKDDIDKLTENNFLVLSYGSMSMGTQWDELSSAYNETVQASSTLSVALEHRAPNRPWAFAFGLSYYKNQQEGLAMKTLAIDGLLYYSLLFNSTFSIDLVGQITGSGDIQFSDPNADEYSRGLLLGAGFGGQVRLFPASQWGLVGGLKMMKLKIYDAEAFSANNEEFTITSLGGLHLYLGISYKL